MSYFRNFKKGTFRVNDKTLEVVNIAHYTRILEKIADDISFYTYYNLVNGDRLDTISQKIYGTPEYYWTIFLLNKNIINTYEYVAKEYNFELIEYLSEKYPGYALKLAPEQTLANKFQISEKVSFASYEGILTNKFTSLGYLTVDVTSENNFPLNQTFTITGETSGDSVEIANVVEYYNAPHHYETSDGEWVLWNNLLGTPVTILEYETSINDTYSQLKVIRPDKIYNITSEFERQMGR